MGTGGSRARNGMQQVYISHLLLKSVEDINLFAVSITSSCL